MREIKFGSFCSRSLNPSASAFTISLPTSWNDPPKSSLPSLWTINRLLSELQRGSEKMGIDNESGFGYTSTEPWPDGTIFAVNGGDEKLWLI
jgi:hypothetical protein